MNGNRGNRSGRRGRGIWRRGSNRSSQNDHPYEHSDHDFGLLQAAAAAPEDDADFTPARPWLFGCPSRYPPPTLTSLGRPPVPLSPLSPLMVPMVPPPFYTEPTVPALQFASNLRPEDIRGEAERVFYMNQRGPPPSYGESQRAAAAALDLSMEPDRPERPETAFEVKSGCSDNVEINSVQNTSVQDQSSKPDRPERPETAFEVKSGCSDNIEINSVQNTSVQDQSSEPARPERPETAFEVKSGCLDNIEINSVQNTSVQDQSSKPDRPERPETAFEVKSGCSDNIEINSVQNTSVQDQSSEPARPERPETAFEVKSGCLDNIEINSVQNTSVQDQSSKPDRPERPETAFEVKSGCSDNIEINSVQNTSVQDQSSEPARPERPETAFEVTPGCSGDYTRDYSEPSTSFQAHSIEGPCPKRSKSATHVPQGHPGGNSRVYSTPNAPFQAQQIKQAHEPKILIQVPSSSLHQLTTYSKPASAKSTITSDQAAERSSETKDNQVSAPNCQVAEILQNNSPNTPIDYSMSNDTERIRVKHDLFIHVNDNISMDSTENLCSDLLKAKSNTLDAQPTRRPTSSRLASPTDDSVRAASTSSVVGRIKIRRPTPLYSGSEASNGSARARGGEASNGSARARGGTASNGPASARGGEASNSPARARSHSRRPVFHPSSTPAVNVVAPSFRLNNQPHQTLNYNEFAQPIVQNVHNENFLPNAPPMQEAYDPFPGPYDPLPGPYDPFPGPYDPYPGPPGPFQGPPDPFQEQPGPFLGPPGPFQGPPDPFPGPPNNIVTHMVPVRIYRRIIQHVHISPPVQTQYTGRPNFPQAGPRPQYFAPQQPVLGPRFAPQQPFPELDFQPPPAFMHQQQQQQQYFPPEDFYMGHQEHHFHVQVHVFSPPNPFLLPYIYPNYVVPSLGPPELPSDEAFPNIYPTYVVPSPSAHSLSDEALPPNIYEVPQDSPPATRNKPVQKDQVNDMNPSQPLESPASKKSNTAEGAVSCLNTLAKASTSISETIHVEEKETVDPTIGNKTSSFEKENIDLTVASKTSSFEKENIDLTVASKTSSFEKENIDLTVDSKTSSFEKENIDLTVDSKTSSFKKENIDLTVDSTTSSFEKENIDLTIDTKTSSFENAPVDELRFQCNAPKIYNPEQSSDSNMSTSGSGNRECNTTTEIQSDNVPLDNLAELSLQNNTSEKEGASGSVDVPSLADSDHRRICSKCGQEETTSSNKILVCLPCTRLYHRLCTNPVVKNTDTCVTFCMSSDHGASCQSELLSHVASFFDHFRKDKEEGGVNIKILPPTTERAGFKIKILPTTTGETPPNDIEKNEPVQRDRYVYPSPGSTAKTKIFISSKRKSRSRKSGKSKKATESAVSVLNDDIPVPNTSYERTNNNGGQENSKESSSFGLQKTYASVVASGSIQEKGNTLRGQKAKSSVNYFTREKSTSAMPTSSSGHSENWANRRACLFEEEQSVSSEDSDETSRDKKKRALQRCFGKNCSREKRKADKAKKEEYRYTLDELPVMIQKLKLKAESFDKWVSSVQGALDGDSPTLDIDDLKNLLAEAEDKKFPESELLQGLQLAILEAEKCASVAQQLDSSRMRTRTRMALDNRCKLTVEELTLFYEQIQELACRINEEQLIKGLVMKVREFQAEAKRLLALEVVESKALEQALENGFFLNIELKELPLLKEKLDQMRWLEEVEAARDDDEAMTVETMEELIMAAETLLPFPRLDERLADLGMRLEKTRAWEEKAAKCLDTSGKSLLELKTWEDLLAEAEGIGTHLPSKATVRDNLKKARDWIARTESSLEGSNYPYMEVIEDLVSKGQQLQVQIELMPKLENMLKGAVLWKERASRVFLRRNTPFTLMEALVPRPDLAMGMMRQKKRQRDPSVPYVVCGVKLQGVIDPAAVVAAFKKAEQEELEAMTSLRDENEIKKRINSVESKFCICHKPLSGSMNECALCKDWFHTTCVTLSKGTVRCGGSGDGRPVMYDGETKFLCPVCMRSRRPPLDNVLTLLVALQALPVRLPEGEALQCLTERAMGWQDKARRVLECGEVKGALARLAVVPQPKATKMDQQRRPPPPIPPFNRRDDTMSEDSAPGSPSTEDSSSAVSSDPIASYSATEHAYSTVSKARAKKHVRKTPLVPRTMEEPTVVLSQEGVTTLRHLATEGDLMEVSLGESDVIWRLLQALRPSHTPRSLSLRLTDDSFDLDESETEDMIKNNLKERVARSKRMFEDVDSSSSLGNFPSTSNLLGTKKLKVRNPRDTSKKSQEGTAGKPERKRRGRREGWNLKKTGGVIGAGAVKQKKLNTDEESEGEGEGEGEEEELCAALVCRRPTGSEVDWVQCDGGCELWFHMHCVGLGKHDINEDEDYICKQCLRSESFVEEEEMDLSQIKPEPGEGPDMVEDGLDLASLFSTEENPANH